MKTDRSGEYFFNLKVGDTVQRSLVGVIQNLQVSEITDGLIICGPWKFDRESGEEIDEELRWARGSSGSFLLPKTE